MVLLVSALTCLAWNWYAGKDLNWDQSNYHLYLPHSLLQHRLSQDFFPASIQSYLNPLAYLPFYGMVMAGWHSLVIASLLAMFHALNLFLVYKICRRVLAAEALATPLNVTMALVMGALSPVFWVEVGSSFNDITVSVLTLLALHIGLGIRGDSAPRQVRTALIGSALLMGFTVGLKLTAATYALAGLVFCFAADIRETLRRIGWYCAAGFAGFMTTGGWWAAMVYAEFGNPIFPLYNAVFKSPLFVADNLTLVRFIPGSFWDLIKLPFEMMDPVGWVYTETIAPDLRFALIAVGLPAVGVLGLLSRWRARGPSHPAGARPVSEMPGVRFRFVAFLLLSLALWALTSANGRYGLPIALLTGLPIFWIMRALIPASRIAFAFAILALLQGFHVLWNLDERWTAEQWTPTWFELNVPKDAILKPSLYLGVGMQSNAYLAPFVHPQSSFVNIVGQTSIELDTAAGLRLQKLIRQYDGRVRVLTGANLHIVNEPAERAKFIRQINVPLQRFGLAANPAQCQVFTSTRAKGIFVDKTGRLPIRDYFVMGCEINPVPIDPQQEQRRRDAGRIMDAVVATCPHLFKPRTSSVDRVPEGFVRRYLGTEYELVINADEQVYGAQVRMPIHVDFGVVEDWKRGTRTDFPCPARRRSSPWFDGRPIQ